LNSTEYIENKYVGLLRLNNYERFYREFWKRQEKLLESAKKLSKRFRHEVEAPQWFYYTVLHRLGSAHAYIEKMSKLEKEKNDARRTFDFHRLYESCLNEFYGASLSLKSLIDHLTGVREIHEGEVYASTEKSSVKFQDIRDDLLAKLPNLKQGIRHAATHYCKPFVHLDTGTGCFMQLKKYTREMVFSDYTEEQ